MNLLTTFQNDPFFSGVDLPNALALEHRPGPVDDFDRRLMPRNASDQRDLSLFENPLSFMQSMMSNMGQMITQMEARMNDPNHQGISYSSSTFMSMDGRNPDQSPRIIQATSEKLRGTEGFARTRKAVRDTGRNVEKMEVAHRLGERLHRITKQRDPASGHMLENREFNHIDDENQFEREWHDRAEKLGLKNLDGYSFNAASNRLLPSPSSMRRLRSHSQQPHRLALEENSDHHSQKKDSKRKSKL